MPPRLAVLNAILTVPHTTSLKIWSIFVVFVGFLIMFGMDDVLINGRMEYPADWIRDNLKRTEDSRKTLKIQARELFDHRFSIHDSEGYLFSDINSSGSIYFQRIPNFDFYHKLNYNKNWISDANISDFSWRSFILQLTTCDSNGDFDAHILDDVLNNSIGATVEKMNFEITAARKVFQKSFFDNLQPMYHLSGARSVDEFVAKIHYVYEILGNTIKFTQEDRYQEIERMISKMRLEQKQIRATFQYLSRFSLVFMAFILFVTIVYACRAQQNCYVSIGIFIWYCSLVICLAINGVWWFTWKTNDDLFCNESDVINAVELQFDAPSPNGTKKANEILRTCNESISLLFAFSSHINSSTIINDTNQRKNELIKSIDAGMKIDNQSIVADFEKVSTFNSKVELLKKTLKQIGKSNCLKGGSNETLSKVLCSLDLINSQLFTVRKVVNDSMDKLESAAQVLSTMVDTKVRRLADKMITDVIEVNRYIKEHSYKCFTIVDVFILHKKEMCTFARIRLAEEVHRCGSLIIIEYLILVISQFLCRYLAKKSRVEKGNEVVSRGGV